MSTFDRRRRPKNKTRAAAQKAASDTLEIFNNCLIDSNIDGVIGSLCFTTSNGRVRLDELTTSYRMTSYDNN